MRGARKLESGAVDKEKVCGCEWLSNVLLAGLQLLSKKRVAIEILFALRWQGSGGRAMARARGLAARHITARTRQVVQGINASRQVRQKIIGAINVFITPVGFDRQSTETL